MVIFFHLKCFFVKQSIKCLFADITSLAEDVHIKDSTCGSPCESSEVMFASQFSYREEGMGYGYLAVQLKQSVKVISKVHVFHWN